MLPGADNDSAQRSPRPASNHDTESEEPTSVSGWAIAAWAMSWMAVGMALLLCLWFFVFA